MKSIYILANLIFMRISQTGSYRTPQDKFILVSRQFGAQLNAIFTEDEMLAEYPGGKWLTGINVSDTITFEDK